VEDLAVSVISTISQTLKVLRCMSHANKRLSEKQQPSENLLVYTCVFSPPHPLFFPVWKNLGEFSKKNNNGTFVPRNPGHQIHPKLWGYNFGLGLEALRQASKRWGTLDILKVFSPRKTNGCRVLSPEKSMVGSDAFSWLKYSSPFLRGTIVDFRGCNCSTDVSQERKNCAIGFVATVQVGWTSEIRKNRTGWMIRSDVTWHTRYSLRTFFQNPSSQQLANIFWDFQLRVIFGGSYLHLKFIPWSLHFFQRNFGWRLVEKCLFSWWFCAFCVATICLLHFLYFREILDLSLLNR